MKLFKNIPKNYFNAVAVMVGYIIGVGMFGLPYLVSKAGVLAFLFFIIVLGMVQYLLHLIYASLIIVTSGFHRLPGYVELYLGKRGKHVVFAAKMVGNMGALLAYIIITGIFLHQFLSPLFGHSEFFYASVLFLFEALIIYFGIGMIARMEFFMTGFLLIIIILIIWKGFNFIDPGNYLMVDWKNFFVPYGAVLFSLNGCGSMPIVAKLLDKDKKNIKSVIGFGTFLSVLIIVVFTLVVVGISGPNTSPDSLVGVSGIIKHEVVLLALIFGIVTMITSFIGVAESIRETLNWDYKVNKHLSWALAVFVPYIFYLAGFQNLIKVISFAGGVAGGVSSIILILIFVKLKETKNPLISIKKIGISLFKQKFHNILVYILLTLFLVGIIYEIFHFLFSM